MPLAKPYNYNHAKRRLMRVLAEIEPDRVVPDQVRMSNIKLGFVFTLSHADEHIERIVPWRGSVNLEREARRALNELAEAQWKSSGQGPAATMDAVGRRIG